MASRRPKHRWVLTGASDGSGNRLPHLRTAHGCDPSLRFFRFVCRRCGGLLWTERSQRSSSRHTIALESVSCLSRRRLVAVVEVTSS